MAVEEAAGVAPGAVPGATPSARRTGFWRCVLAGLVAGVAATALVVPVAAGLQAATGHRFEDLAAGHLAQATVLSTLLGAATYYLTARWTRRPVRVFAVLVAVFTIGYSLVVAYRPPEPGFAVVAGALHLVVAAVTIAVFAVARDRVRTAAPAGFTGYPLIIASLVTIFLVGFIAVEALGVPLLTDPGPWLEHPTIAAAAVGVGLLLVDVLVPVPSSAVMVAHGALFGVAGGTALSLVGGLGATLLGFGIGRRSTSLVDRLVAPDARRRAERWLARYGPMAIVATRPVPMVAETTAIVAGTSPMRWRWAAIAGAAGNVVPAVLYAMTGAVATSLSSQTLVFGVVLAIAAVFWVLGRHSSTPGQTASPATRAATRA